MDYVVTLIAAPDSGELTGELADSAASALAGTGAIVQDPVWLAEGEACDLQFAAPVGLEVAPGLRHALAGAPLDIGILPALNRRKRLLVADMESTIIEQELLDEIADSLGLHDQIAPITARAMAGELDFAEALRQRVGLLKGVPTSLLDDVAGRISLTPGARTLVQTMRAAGALTALVSGGFSCFTERVAATCGFDSHQANHLIIEDGRLTGTVAEPLLDRNAKAEALAGLAAGQGLEMGACCAVGDGANDIALLRAAGLGVGFRPKTALRQAADVTINHGDLTALLYLQGYAKETFTC